MHVDDPLRKALEEGRREEVHIAGADDEPGAVLLEPVRHRGVALLAVRELVERKALGRHAGRGCPAKRPHVRLARRDRRHGQTGVDERLQIRPLPGDEDADHAIRPMTSSWRTSDASSTTQ
jgi:hypothetical protein